MAGIAEPVLREVYEASIFTALLVDMQTALPASQSVYFFRVAALSLVQESWRTSHARSMERLIASYYKVQLRGVSKATLSARLWEGLEQRWKLVSSALRSS